MPAVILHHSMEQHADNSASLAGSQLMHKRTQTDKQKKKRNVDHADPMAMTSSGCSCYAGSCVAGEEEADF